MLFDLAVDQRFRRKQRWLRSEHRLTHRLRAVPHFSSGIVEWAKRERAWKSPHTRKGTFFSLPSACRLFSHVHMYTRTRWLVTVTRCGDTPQRQIVSFALGNIYEHLCLRNRILSPQQVAQNQINLLQQLIAHAVHAEWFAAACVFRPILRAVSLFSWSVEQNARDT